MSAASKAWYWLAAGVLALGLNGYYQDGGLPALHRIAERSTQVVGEARAQFGQAATLAEVSLADQALVRCPRGGPAVVGETPLMVPPEAQARLALAQEHLATLQRVRVPIQMARLQQVIAREEMRGAQVEIENGRIQVLTSQGGVRVTLPPLPRVEVNAPRGPAIEFLPN